MTSKVFIIAGPSGVGKTYLANTLLERYPDSFIVPNLVTTRSRRPGEVLVDRQCVSKETFDVMRANGDFTIAQEFNSNWYGFPRDMLVPKDRHVVANAWPALVPEFAELPNIVFVGLRATPDNQVLLRERMLRRGDSQMVVAERMIRVKIDLDDLEVVRDTIAQRGRIFTVDDDTTIPEQVIPWIVSQAGL